MRDIPVRAVVFDLGNTLWFEAKAPDLDAIFEMEAAAVRPLLRGWSIDASFDLVSTVREVWAAYERQWRTEHESRTYREPSLPSLIRWTLADHGVAITDEQSVDWWRAAWIPVKHFGYQLYPDVVDVLSELHDLGLGVGINSNRPCTWDMLAADLERFGLSPYVDGIVCSGDTGWSKPHPSTFELILERMGVPASAAAMVGDSCSHDMVGAKAVGMRTVWKLNGRYDVSPCPHADYAVHDLAELLSLPIIDRGPRPVLRTESLTPHEDSNADRY
jgi:HAD superfamily hydrolase (TIGR01549 family)